MSKKILVLLKLSTLHLINCGGACAARVTVVVLSFYICLSMCLHLFLRFNKDVGIGL